MLLYNRESVYSTYFYSYALKPLWCGQEKGESIQLSAAGDFHQIEQPSKLENWRDNNECPTAPGSLKDDFLQPLSDHQSILISVSSRCLRKGSVCEHPHLMRIKYYGSKDKPLGNFLKDSLFNVVSYNVHFFWVCFWMLLLYHKILSELG